MEIKQAKVITDHVKVGVSAIVNPPSHPGEGPLGADTLIEAGQTLANLLHEGLQEGLKSAAEKAYDLEVLEKGIGAVAATDPLSPRSVVRGIKFGIDMVGPGFQVKSLAESINEESSAWRAAKIAKSAFELAAAMCTKYSGVRMLMLRSAGLAAADAGGWVWVGRVATGAHAGHGWCAG